MQHPLMAVHAGGDDDAVARWEATAQVEISVLIRRYLSENQPPTASSHHRLFLQWAGDLAAAGEADLAALGARRLRCAG